MQQTFLVELWILSVGSDECKSIKMKLTYLAPPAPLSSPGSVPPPWA